TRLSPASELPAAGRPAGEQLWPIQPPRAAFWRPSRRSQPEKAHTFARCPQSPGTREHGQAREAAAALSGAAIPSHDAYRSAMLRGAPKSRPSAAITKHPERPDWKGLQEGEGIARSTGGIGRADGRR